MNCTESVVAVINLIPENTCLHSSLEMNQPENLTKDRLKAELKKHGVSFQPHETKDYYVQLYRKEVLRGKGGRGRTVRSEFSSDEEFVRQSPRLAKKQMVGGCYLELCVGVYFIPGVR